MMNQFQSEIPLEFIDLPEILFLWFGPSSAKVFEKIADFIRMLCQCQSQAILECVVAKVMDVFLSKLLTQKGTLVLLSADCCWIITPFIKN